MPRRFLMTCIPSRKGWMKEYSGKKYAVSCAQLRCPPSKKASWLAVNQWWENKKDEIDGADTPATVGSVLDQVAAVLGVENLPADLTAQILSLHTGQAAEDAPTTTITQARDKWLKSLLMSVNARNIDISRYAEGHSWGYVAR